MTGMVNCRLIGLAPSVAVAVNVKTEAVVGVPEITPSGDRVSPGGIKGEDHKTVPGTPVAVKV